MKFSTKEKVNFSDYGFFKNKKGNLRNSSYACFTPNLPQMGYTRLLWESCDRQQNDPTY